MKKLIVLAVLIANVSCGDTVNNFAEPEQPDECYQSFWYGNRNIPITICMDADNQMCYLDRKDHKVEISCTEFYRVQDWYQINNID